MTPPRDSAELALTLGSIALERKAIDLTVLDLRRMTSFTDFMIILSGRSARQVSSLGEHILRSAKKQLKTRPLGSEGSSQGNWVLLDYGSVIIHIFLDEIRGYYDLESLWSEAPRYDWTEKDHPPELEPDPPANQPRG